MAAQQIRLDFDRLLEKFYTARAGRQGRDQHDGIRAGRRDAIG